MFYQRNIGAVSVLSKISLLVLKSHVTGIDQPLERSSLGDVSIFVKVKGSSPRIERYNAAQVTADTSKFLLQEGLDEYDI